jgi:tetratricopeptide (TPR) repeat protein
MKKSYTSMKSVYCLLFFAFSLISFQVDAQHEGLSYYVDGENLRRAGQHDKAIAEFNKAIQREPANYKYIYSKAVSEFQTRKIDAALNSVNNVIKLKDDFVSAYLLAAKIYQTKNEIDRALFFYDQAFKYEEDIDKKVGYKLLVMRKLTEKNDFKGAYERVKEAKTVAPQNKDVLFYFAKLSNILGNYEDAKNAIIELETQIKSLKPEDNAKYYYELGLAYYKLDDFEKSKEAWSKANIPPYNSKIAKFSPKYFCSVALAYYKFYENELSKQYVSQAVKIQKDFPMAHVLLAQLSKRNSDHSKTIAHYEAALKNEKDVNKKLGFYDKIADLHLESNDFQGCLKSISEALQIRADDTQALLTKANALYKMGSYKESVDLIQSVLKQRIDEGAKNDFNFLIGLCGKKMGDKRLAKEGFVACLRSTLKDAAELELREMRETAELEKVNTEDE